MLENCLEAKVFVPINCIWDDNIYISFKICKIIAIVIVNSYFIMYYWCFFFFFQIMLFIFKMRIALNYNCKMCILTIHFWFNLHHVTRLKKELGFIEWVGVVIGVEIGVGVCGDSWRHAGGISSLDCQTDSLDKPGRLPRLIGDWM
jgi:hypothetical protein